MQEADPVPEGRAPWLFCFPPSRTDVVKQQTREEKSPRQYALRRRLESFYYFGDLDINKPVGCISLFGVIGTLSQWTYCSENLNSFWS